MAQQNNIYALFVGINRYEYRSPSGRDINLYGCENDVHLISELLQQRYNIPNEHSLILLNEQATKQNIVNGFRDHLAKANKDDIVIFYYSGHGSTEKTDQRLWVSERDHRNETLVCHDSRTSAQPYDLADKELRYLIYQLSKKGVNVITIIDSCNSGDATRYLDDEEEEVSVRQTSGSHATRPLDSYIFFDDPQAQSWINNFADMPEGDHIALSACRNDQLSKEVYFRRKKYGVFTYNLHQALQYQHVAPSYRNLVDAAAQRVAIKVDNQTPQLDPVGENIDINQTFLATELQPVTYPVSYRDGEWWLNAGIAQGINPNARLKLLLGKDGIDVTVIEVSPEDSPEQGSRLSISDASVLDPGKPYQAAMIDPAIAKLPVSFSGSTQYTNALMQALNTSGSKHYLQPDETAEYILAADEQAIVFNRKRGLPLDVDPVRGFVGNPPREWVALKLAAHMAQWHHTLSLAYALREEAMPRDLVNLAIEQYDPINNHYSELAPDGGAFDLRYQKASSGELVKPEIKLSVSINDSADWPQDQDIFISLLFLDPIKGSTHVLANQEVLRKAERLENDGTSRVIKPASPVWGYFRTVRGQRKDSITFSIADRLLKADGSGRTKDYLKLIISNFAIDIGALKQTTLSNLLEQLNPAPGRRGDSKSIEGFDDEEAESGIFVQKACTQTVVLNIVKAAGA